MNKAASKQKKSFSILNVIIILLSIVLAISILITIGVLRDTSSVYYDRESNLFYYLTDQEYSGLTTRYYDNGIGRENDSKVKAVADFYAVGRYFEKAFMAHAYEKADNQQKASQMREDMQALEPEMGQFAGEKDKILAVFDALPTLP